MSDVNEAEKAKQRVVDVLGEALNVAAVGVAREAGHWVVALRLRRMDVAVVEAATRAAGNVPVSFRVVGVVSAW